MKKLFITVLATVFFGCFLGKAQPNSTNDGTVNNVIPTTTPASISQFEVRGRALTQNSLNSPTGAQITGSFNPAARWNTMGNIPAGSQVLNGFRTQTDGRALAWGHSVPNSGTVSNGFIEWIGNDTSSPAVAPGNLEFRYALSSTGAAGARVRMFTMAPTNGTIPSFNYADSNTFVGQKQNGSFGSFGSGDIWSATGQVTIPSVLTAYGSRHQYEGYTVNTGLLKIGSTISAVLDYGSDSVAGLTSSVFKFRAFTDPNSSSSIKNVWQSGDRYGNIVFGRQDYNSVSNSSFYVSVFDGVASSSAAVAVPISARKPTAPPVYAAVWSPDQRREPQHAVSAKTKAPQIKSVSLGSFPHLSKCYKKKSCFKLLSSHYMS